MNCTFCAIFLQYSYRINKQRYIVSISTIDVVMSRIESATKESPIAVFKSKNGKFRAVFYTEKTKQEIELMSSIFIGLFDNTMNVDSVASEILSHL